MIRALPHVLARIFGPPLLIAPAKLDQMLLGLHAAMLHRGSLLAELPDIRGRVEGDSPSTATPRGYSIRSGIATVPVHGVLVRRAGQIQPDSTILQSYEDVTRVLRTARADDRVRGILLDIDSPGGEAGGIFDIAAEIRATAQAKPVWSIANDDALSAAYVLAAATQRIYATQTASLGSLGVVALHADQSAFDAAEGIKYTYVYRGAHKIDANPHEALTDDAQATIQAEVDRLYAKLVDMVGEHRGVPGKQLRATEAAIYFGEHAKAQKLADRIGTIDEAHAALVIHSQKRGTRMSDPTPPVDPAAQTPTPPATPPVDNNVIQLRVDEARTQLRAEATEIAQLCLLAKHPELAAQYISEGLTAAAVRTKLQAQQAADADKAPVTPIDTSDARGSASAISGARKAAASRQAAMSAAHPTR
jgi:signal peptide peptidase SppA